MDIHLITSYLFLGIFIVVILIINSFKGKLDNEEENIKKTHKNAITIFILDLCFYINYLIEENAEIQILFLLIIITVAIYVFIYAFLLTIRYLINKKNKKNRLYFFLFYSIYNFKYCFFNPIICFNSSPCSYKQK
mgnify:CR=1 FL=1